MGLIFLGWKQIEYSLVVLNDLFFEKLRNKTTHFTDMCIPNFFSLPNDGRKREKMRNAHISEMRSNIIFLALETLLLLV
jgi:hypothetical protein